MTCEKRKTGDIPLTLRVNPFRVAVVTGLHNPLGTNWIRGFQSMGLKVVVLDRRERPINRAEMEAWGISSDIPIITVPMEGPLLDEHYRGACNILEGEPDCLFGWYGSQTLNLLSRTHQRFPQARVVLCIDALPNAAILATEIRELIRFGRSDAWIDGYVHYSETMRRSFERFVPGARRKPSVSLVEPFLLNAFVTQSTTEVHDRLIRHDERPHVIFTGRSDHLWSRGWRMRKDALGPFFNSLADRGVHVYLSQGADTRGHDRLHEYPPFTNWDVFAGKMGKYINDFDAHVVLYNEFNGTIRRRSANGLATRFALAVTSTCPIAVTSTSTFTHEYWEDHPDGFHFSSVDELVEKLSDDGLLAAARASLSNGHSRYSFEACSAGVHSFLQRVIHSR